MYRVYDKQNKRWITENIYLSTYEDLYISKKTLFGEKLELASKDRYVKHRSIGLTDKNNVDIYEGDICSLEPYDTSGIVSYHEVHSSYYLFDMKHNKYHRLTESFCSQISVIGNVFDGEVC